MRSDGARFADNLTTDNLITIDTTEQSTDVVAGLGEVKDLTEPLERGDNGLTGI